MPAVTAGTINAVCGVLCIVLLGALLHTEEGSDLKQIADVQVAQINALEESVAAMQRELNITRTAVHREEALLAHARRTDAAVKKNLTAARTVLQESKLLFAELGPELSNTKDSIDHLQGELRRCEAATERRIEEAKAKRDAAQTRRTALEAELQAVRNGTAGIYR